MKGTGGNQSMITAEVRMKLFKNRLSLFAVAAALVVAALGGDFIFFDVGSVDQVAGFHW
jgi:hypothetical protein